MMFSVSCSRLAASVAALLGPKGDKPVKLTNNFLIFQFFGNNTEFLGWVSFSSMFFTFSCKS